MQWQIDQTNRLVSLRIASYGQMTDIAGVFVIGFRAFRALEELFRKGMTICHNQSSGAVSVLDSSKNCCNGAAR
jgi:hypothetical protein